MRGLRRYSPCRPNHLTQFSQLFLTQRQYLVAREQFQRLLLWPAELSADAGGRDPYIPVAKLADRYGQRPSITLTFAFFTLFPLLMVLAPSPAWLLPAFIVAGLREIGEPSRKALIVDLAGETYRGQAVGLYYLPRGVAIFPGAFLGSLLWQVEPSLPFWGGFVLIAAGLVFFVGWGPGRKAVRISTPP